MMCHPGERPAASGFIHFRRGVNFFEVRLVCMTAPQDSTSAYSNFAYSNFAYPNQSGFPPTGPPPVSVSVPPTNGMAIAALILVFVFFPVGIVLGHVARGQIKRSGEDGKGLATAALIIGYRQVAATLAVIGIAGVLVALGAR